ncbi:MAG: hypothetical protein J7D61_17355, partial [Marichromatium sp.]|nr:hypothetical protein [Marichromatium sp.]
EGFHLQSLAGFSRRSGCPFYLFYLSFYLILSIQYNLRRPHESLGDLSPIEFLNRRGHAAVSIYGWT